MRWMPADGSSSFECEITTSFCGRTWTTLSIIQDITVAVCGFEQMDFIVEVAVLCGRPGATINTCPSNKIWGSTLMTAFYEITSTSIKLLLQRFWETKCGTGACNSQQGLLHQRGDMWAPRMNPTNLKILTCECMSKVVLADVQFLSNLPPCTVFMSPEMTRKSLWPCHGHSLSSVHAVIHLLHPGYKGAVYGNG